MKADAFTQGHGLSLCVLSHLNLSNGNTNLANGICETPVGGQARLLKKCLILKTKNTKEKWSNLFNLF
jgi:hypothetical protein